MAALNFYVPNQSILIQCLILSRKQTDRLSVHIVIHSLTKILFCVYLRHFLLGVARWESYTSYNMIANCSVFCISHDGSEPVHCCCCIKHTSISNIFLLFNMRGSLRCCLSSNLNLRFHPTISNHQSINSWHICHKMGLAEMQTTSYPLLGCDTQL